VVALVILGVAVVAFVSGLESATRESDVHRKLATVQTVLRDEIESLRSAAASCSGNLAPTYSAPAGYTLSTTPVSIPCPTVGAPDTVVISAQSTDGRASDTVTLVVRST
jgi:type II secretory pathway pseudopilin PulG